MEQSCGCLKRTCTEQQQGLRYTMKCWAGARIGRAG